MERVVSGNEGTSWRLDHSARFTQYRFFLNGFLFFVFWPALRALDYPIHSIHYTYCHFNAPVLWKSIGCMNHFVFSLWQHPFLWLPTSRLRPYTKSSSTCAFLHEAGNFRVKENEQPCSSPNPNPAIEITISGSRYERGKRFPARLYEGKRKSYSLDDERFSHAGSLLVALRDYIPAFGKSGFLARRLTPFFPA